MSALRIMAEAQGHGITFKILPDGTLKLASKGQPPARIIASVIKGAGATFSA